MEYFGSTILIYFESKKQLSARESCFLYNLNGDPERARTVDLQRDRLAF